MSSKYKNKYRIKSTRLQSWNYGWIGSYFVTICTKNREHHFGGILETQNIASLKLSDIGNIVKQEWLKTPEIRSDMNIKLDEFIIMPNHFHAIVFIGENEYNKFGYTKCRDTMHCVSTTSTNINSIQNKFGPQCKNLASIIRGFKSVVTKQARMINREFAWQSRFYDRIIINEKEFYKIKQYIINNPNNWDNDRNNQDGLWT